MSKSVGTTLKSPAMTTGLRLRKSFAAWAMSRSNQRKLVVELRAGLRVSVRQIDRADDHRADGCFQVAAVIVRVVARQLFANFRDLEVTRQDGDAVPRALAVPERGVSRLGDGRLRKGVLRPL